MAVVASGRPATTWYRVLDRLEADPPTTLILAELHSGRTHQIRVHMAAIGHPVVGDPWYGPAHRQGGTGPLMLHAHRLCLNHPASGLPMTFESRLPTRLASELRRFGWPALSDQVLAGRPG
jgi:23S rRNA pseudouridine1911/1915/1917 synthase